jgi:hypothetical protein
LTSHGSPGFLRNALRVLDMRRDVHDLAPRFCSLSRSHPYRRLAATSLHASRTSINRLDDATRGPAAASTIVNLALRAVGIGLLADEESTRP